MNRSEITEFRSQLKEITRILNQHTGFLANLEKKISLVVEHQKGSNGKIAQNEDDLRILNALFHRLEIKVVKWIAVFSTGAAGAGIIIQQILN